MDHTKDVSLLLHAQAEAERENDELRRLLQEARDESADLRRGLIAIAIDTAMSKRQTKKRKEPSNA